MSTYPRTIITLQGADNISFLQGLTTQDVTTTSETRLMLAAFLSPQGKLLFDAFLWRTRDALMLDTDSVSHEAFLAFLTRYKLRAKVTITTSTLQLSLLSHHASDGFADPRHPDMPRRFYSDTTHDDALSAAAYHHSRTALAIPEAAYDTAGDDTAMDIGYDALGAISFTKGCYVGQEVTARMHYKQIARKSILAAHAQATLPAFGSPIVAGPLTLGSMRSHSGSEGLALIRLDTWEEAMQAGHPITCEHIPITLAWPEWATAKRELWCQGKVSGTA